MRCVLHDTAITEQELKSMNKSAFSNQAYAITESANSVLFSSF